MSENPLPSEVFVKTQSFKKGFVIMKKFLLLSTAFAGALWITGCTSIVTSDGASQIPQPDSDHPGYTAQFSHKQTRVEGAVQINVLFGIFAWGAEGYADNSKLSSFSFMPSPENFAKSAAVYSACQKNKADTLLGTRYILNITDYFVFKTINCKVAGFPATMDGVVEKQAYVLPGGGLTWLAKAPVVLPALKVSNNCTASGADAMTNSQSWICTGRAACPEKK